MNLLFNRTQFDLSAGGVNPLICGEENYSILVIGYGNTLRSDDGVGQWVAAEVEGWELQNVRSLPVHQLTPELAELLASASSVIFVDAYPASEDALVEVCPLEPVDSNNFSLGHMSNPRSLLALTQAVYGCTPQAWLVAIPAVNFQLGERFSPKVQQGLAVALDKIRRLLGEVFERSDGKEDNRLVRQSSYKGFNHL
ncbi:MULTISPECIES: hydrogenase maturation protease [unclassified Coleofasciculus]|uniref:hydrogenase maturation protease n=1 Tax=unclassified Coleofasciculus TaxID=2692782 RepID=UPI001880DD21|nr:MULTISPECIES: hydrogenase maturation protease [unclassified Coleofasciculus]MBE9129605.1 hydrogenase maturation protease [Coleofasciculus sp. LEGE 07081]MBE9151351.1 hydrogenase maturation protease [Coleofasciculus sp. LEGE 07092]